MSSKTAITGRHADIFVRLSTANYFGGPPIHPLDLPGVWGSQISSGYYVKVARATRWTFKQEPSETVTWADSDTGGYTTTVAGARRIKATTSGKFDNENSQWSLFKGGDRVDLWLALDSRAPVPHPGYWASRGYGSIVLTGALCLNFQLDVSINSEEVVGWTAEWENCGPFFINNGDRYSVGWSDDADYIPSYT